MVSGARCFEYRALATISTIDNFDPLIEKGTPEMFGRTGVVMDDDVDATRYLRTGEPICQRMTRFWIRPRRPSTS